MSWQGPAKHPTSQAAASSPSRPPASGLLVQVGAEPVRTGPGCKVPLCGRGSRALGKPCMPPTAPHRLTARLPQATRGTNSQGAGFLPLWTTPGRKVTFRWLQPDDLGLRLFSLSLFFPHRKRDAGLALQIQPSCDAQRLIPNCTSAKGAGGAAGKEDSTAYLSRKPRGQNGPRIRLGDCGQKRMAGREPASQATGSQGFKTFAGVYLDASE